ncbi:hypothetical protein FSARC_8122 [Fusarium sarcochroum]|uniref:Uncharacterized protein n=1 Tax=Fusarium sarcochroum TaxID=1208366 RepID=A0A8H4TTN7_9HYPO|nr:hypothetical protein FSARC_8122 [Fusarium sarcochroum]
MAALERWQNRLSSPVGSRQPDSTHVSTRTVSDDTERQGLRQRFLRLRISPSTPTVTTTESNDVPQIHDDRPQPLADSNCVLITSLPTGLEGDPTGQDIPGVKLKCFYKVIPEELNNRFFDIKVLYTQPLIQAISRGNRNPGYISMKLKYLGLNVRTAQFHIVIQCEKKVAKRVRKFFAQRHVEEELVPDFCILVLDKAPLRLATGDIIEVFSGKAPNETWCGTPIMMTRGTASAMATLGGIILIETSQKHLYGMTAAHPLKRLQESHSGSLATRRYSDSNSNANSDYDSEDSEIDWDSVTDSERSESPLECADGSLSAKRHESGFNEVLGTIFCDTFNTQAKKNYDWAIIDVSSQHVLPNKVINTVQGEASGIGENAEAEVFLDESSIQSDSLTKRVIVIKEGGSLPGKMSFYSSSMMISPGSTFVEAHDLSVDHGFSE